jgi:hypothetical protein
MDRTLLNMGRVPWNGKRRIAPLAIAAFGLHCSPFLLRPLIAAEPSQLLAHAEQLADLYNWYDAQLLYAQAENGFNLAGDERNAMFARVSRLRGEMQVRPLPELVEAIDSILTTDVAKGDKQLQLRCLIVRGDVDLEIDAPAARDDWAAALALASRCHQE